MHRRKLLLLLLAPALLIGSAYAQTTITLNTASAGLQFYGNGSTTTLSFLGSCGGTSNCVSGTTTNGGTYAMWFSGPAPSLGGPTGNLYPVLGGTLNFNFVLGSDSMQGTISLASVNSDPNSPYATLLTGTFTADPSLTTAGLSSWLNTQSNVTLTLDLNSPLNGIVANGGTASGTPSGEIVPVPEPATLALIGSGLLGIGGTIKRRLQVAS